MNNFLKQKVDRKTTEIENKIKKVKKTLSSWKVKLLAILIGVSLFISMLFLAFYNISKWYDKHEVIFQFPITIDLHYPVVIKQRRPKTIKILITPTPKPETESENEKDIVLAQKHGDILWKIYQLETQRGLTDYCRNNNKGWGGFGTMYDGEIICYKTFKEATERAEYWLTKFGVDSNLIDALCIWNLGKNVINNKVVPHVNCGYYQKFLTVL